MFARLLPSWIACLVLGLPACAASSAQPAATPEVVVAVSAPGAKDGAAPGSETADASNPGEASGEGDAGDAVAKAKLEDLSKLEIQMLQVLGASGSTVSELFQAGSAGLLDSAAASGVRVGTGGPMGGGGGALAGGGGAGLAGLGTGSKAGTGVGGAAGPSAPAGPTATARTSIASTTGGAVGNANAVVAGTAAGMRRCYARELSQNPGAATGSVRFDVSIGPNGEVLSAGAVGAMGIASAVVTCAQARLQAASFAPPEGGSAGLVVVVAFDKQQP